MWVLRHLNIGLFRETALNRPVETRERLFLEGSSLCLSQKSAILHALTSLLLLHACFLSQHILFFLYTVPVVFKARRVPVVEVVRHLYCAL